MLRTNPAVFAVEDTYQIMVQVSAPSLYWVEVAGECYYDESNGIMRSLSELHRAVVPMAVLDAAGEYTICVRPLVARKDYFTETAPVQTFTYTFHPVPQEGMRLYHISDAHNSIDLPVAAARGYGDIDLLVLNGDVLDSSGDPSKFDNIYDICSRLTAGNIPVVFSRGNHDLRGNYAEQFAAYTPNAGGNTYYTFRVGGVWGLLLDCGEDKSDEDIAYGFTVACHPFRLRETAFLESMIANKEREYAAPGVHTRLVISHVPFTQLFSPPFDIEGDIYREWARLLREEIHPDLMLCGHTHSPELRLPGHGNDHYGQPCPVVVSGSIDRKGGFIGFGCEITPDGFTITYTNQDGVTTDTHTLPRL